MFVGFSHLCQGDEEPSLKGKRFFLCFFSFIFLVLVSCETLAATQESESSMFAGFSHLCQADEEPSLGGKWFFFVFFSFIFLVMV